MCGEGLGGGRGGWGAYAASQTTFRHMKRFKKPSLRICCFFFFFCFFFFVCVFGEFVCSLFPKALLDFFILQADIEDHDQTSAPSDLSFHWVRMS